MERYELALSGGFTVVPPFPYTISRSSSDEVAIAELCLSGNRIGLTIRRLLKIDYKYLNLCLK